MLVGTTALVGAPAQSGSGAAYFYTRGFSWTAGPRLRPGDLTAGSRFGDSVAFDGQTALVGAPQQDGPGAAYVFEHATDIWIQRQKLGASDLVAGDSLGQAVALHTDTALLGAPTHDTDATFNRGAAYVFSAPPVVSDVERQFTFEDVTLGPIGFTIADPDGNATPAVVAVSSSNSSLVPDENIVLSGSGTGRTISLMPVANLSGTTVITITARDGLISTTDTFDVSVLPVNDAPTMSQIYSGTVEEDRAYEFSFSVADPETDPESLGVWAISSDRALVSVDRILLFATGGGSWWARVSPAANANGTLAIAIAVTDGQAITAQSFLFTITPVNDAPRISAIGPQHVRTGRVLAPLTFTVEDLETAAAGLSVVARSSNPALVPDANLVVQGGGRLRTIAAVPAPDATGNTTITLTVSDGLASATSAFTLTVDEDDARSSTMLTASDGVSFDQFGTSVAIDGDTLVSGAPAALASDRGAAYVFTRRHGLWLETAKLVAPDIVARGYFGSAVAVDGETILVGAPAEPGSLASAGAVYVFLKQGDAWVFQTKLTAPIGAATFGYSVALDGDTAIVGAPWSDGGGRAYVVQREGTVWSDAVRLETNATSYGEFGESVAIEGDTVLVGEPYSNTVGAAHVFVRSGGVWTPQATLVPGDATPYAFGWRVGLAGRTAYVGSPGSDQQQGAIYVFSANGPGWSFQQRLTVDGLPPRVGSAAGPSLGVSLAVDGDQVLAGTAWLGGRGSAYLFVRRGASWTVSPAYSVDGGIYGNEFFAEVAVSGGTMAIGSMNHPAVASMAGAIFVFTDTMPVLSGPEVLVTFEDVPLGPVALTPTDPDDLDATLAISVSSSNPAVIPDAGLAIGGSGSARTLTISPVANASGTSDITLTVSDGRLSTTRTFPVTVLPVNDLPTIAPIADQTAGQPQPVATVTLAVGDVETPAADLRVWAISSDPALVPTDHLLISGAGAARTLTVTPAVDRHGTTSIAVLVSDGTSAVTTGFTFTVSPPADEPTPAPPTTPPASSPTYYFAEGATGSFFDLDILIANPTAAPAPVAITFLTEAGVRVTEERMLPAASRTTIRVDDIPGLESTAVSTIVTSTSGVPLVVERTMWWDASAYGAHTEQASAGPSPTWYFAEGAQGFFSTYILLVNPQATSNTARVTYLREGAAPIEREYAIAPHARLTIDAGADPDLVDRSFGAVVRFDRPGVAERAMYFGRDPLWSGGHGSAGVVAPSSSWFLAEGATGEYFATFLLLANPQASDAVATITYFPASGIPVIRQRTIPAFGRTTIDLSGEAPSLANAAVATRVESTVPIIVERSQYWAPPQWLEAHNSFGVTEAATHWGLAEGRVGGPHHRQTYILLANPGDAAAEVTITFLRTTGAPLVKRFSVAPTSRFNVAVTGLTGDVPELGDEDFGADIVSTQPIVVERALYGDANGVTWAAGTNATATRLP